MSGCQGVCVSGHGGAGVAIRNALAVIILKKFLMEMGNRAAELGVRNLGKLPRFSGKFSGKFWWQL
jgi:hypothetical protein